MFAGARKKAPKRRQSWGGKTGEMVRSTHNGSKLPISNLTSRSIGSTVTDSSVVRQTALTARAIEVAEREHRIMNAMKMKNLPESRSRVGVRKEK